MAVELRRWSRVNERAGRAEACYIAPCQIQIAWRLWQQIDRTTVWLAMGEVAVPWFVVVDGSPFASWPLLGLAPTLSTHPACPGPWQTRCARPGLVGLDGIDHKPVAPDPRCQCQLF